MNDSRWIFGSTKFIWLKWSCCAITAMYRVVGFRVSKHTFEIIYVIISSSLSLLYCSECYSGLHKNSCIHLYVSQAIRSVGRKSRLAIKKKLEWTGNISTIGSRVVSGSKNPWQSSFQGKDPYHSTRNSNIVRVASRQVHHLSTATPSVPPSAIKAHSGIPSRFIGSTSFHPKSYQRFLQCIRRVSPLSLPSNNEKEAA